ncbi:hypothetical protein [Methylobacterium sp.]|uniref:hypothetical protein n=1 Tax=Methylobacterium sp. TaxID=409 RepID=UPI003B02CDB2
MTDGFETVSNMVERTSRPLARMRENALFAWSHAGSWHWAGIASLVETCKRNGLAPRAFFADVITLVAERLPNPAVSTTCCRGLARPP